MRRHVFIFATVMAVILVNGNVLAGGYPWQDHGAPFDFLFENNIDTHQQSMVMGNDQLTGFFYIRFTGETQDGVPEAQHADCEMHPEECTSGWVLQGVPITATLLDKPTGGHPTWCVDPADLPDSPGYSHFHWLGPPEHAGGLIAEKTYDGYLLKLTAVDTFFFQHHGGFLVTPGIDAVSHANIVTDCYQGP